MDYSGGASVPEAQPPLLHRTLTFIVIQVNTPAPCCGNSENPSVTEDSFVSSALPAPFLAPPPPFPLFSSVCHASFSPLPLDYSFSHHSNIFREKRRTKESERCKKYIKSIRDWIREDNRSEVILHPRWTPWNRIFFFFFKFIGYV